MTEDQLFMGGLAVLAVLCGLAGIVDGLQRRRQYRALARKRRLPIAQAEGLVEIEGTIESQEPLLSRLTGKPCVAYMASVECRGKTTWIPYADESGSQGFVVRDSTGWATINAEGAEVLFPKERVIFEGSYSELPDRAGAFLKEKDARLLFMDTLKAWRAVECHLPPGETVIVRGRARRDDSGGVIIDRDPEAGMEIAALRNAAALNSFWTEWLLELPVGIVLLAGGLYSLYWLFKNP